MRLQGWGLGDILSQARAALPLGLGLQAVQLGFVFWCAVKLVFALMDRTGKSVLPLRDSEKYLYIRVTQ